MAGRHHGAEFAQMLRPARGDAVGEFGQPRLPHQVDILHFEIAIRPVRAREQEVDPAVLGAVAHFRRSEEHTSELQSLMRISYAVFCLKKKKRTLKQRQNKDIPQQINDTWSY